MMPRVHIPMPNHPRQDSVDSPQVRKWDKQLVVVAEAAAEAVGPLSPGDAFVVVAAAAVASVAIAAPEQPPIVWPVQRPVVAAACRTVLEGTVVAAEKVPEPEPEPPEPDVAAAAAAAVVALVVAG